MECYSVDFEVEDCQRCEPKRKRKKLCATLWAWVEYVAIWLMKLCSYVGISQRVNILQCDSNSVICLAKNMIFHTKAKHIVINYQFVWYMVKDGKVIMRKVDTLTNVANVLTKLVKTNKFKWCYEFMVLKILTVSSQFDVFSIMLFRGIWKVGES
jgi:hypothetical protein